MASAGQAAGSHNDDAAANILENLSARRALPGRRGRAAADRARRPAPVRPAAGEAVRARATRSTASSRSCSTLPRERYDAELREAVGPHAGRGLRRPRLGLLSRATPTPRWRGCTTSSASRRGAHLDPDLRRARSAPSPTPRAPGATTSRRPCAPTGAGRTQAAAILARLVPTPSRPATATATTRAEALADLADDRAGSAPTRPIAVRAFRHAGDRPRSFRFKLYREGEPIALADVLPILDNMGLKALVRGGLPLIPAAPSGERRRGLGARVRARRSARRAPGVRRRSRQVFEDAFLAIWTGQAENDGFNRLVLELAIAWREAALIRALARYRQQSGLDPSPAVQQQALSDHPEVARPDPRAVPPPARSGARAATSRTAPTAARETRGRDRGSAAGGREPRRRPGAAPPGRAGRRDPAHQLLPAGRRRRSPSPTSASRSPAASWPTCRSPSRSARSSSPRRRSRACTCASDPSPAAACAGRTGATTSAPRCWAW